MQKHLTIENVFVNKMFRTVKSGNPALNVWDDVSLSKISLNMAELKLAVKTDLQSLNWVLKV